MKTQYSEIISSLIHDLEEASSLDYGDEKNRHNCANLMFKAYYSISSIEEKEFATKIMNIGSDFDSLSVLEKDHPLYEDDNEEFKKKIQETIDFLRSQLPHDHRAHAKKLSIDPN